MGGGGENELTESKTQRQVVLNVIGKVSLREQREVRKSSEKKGKKNET